MKTLGLLLCLLGIATTALAEEHLWDNFDTYPVGSIADQPGWSGTSLLSTQTAQVSSAESVSPSNALELAWHADGVTAVYTNFTSTYNPTNDHPVIRFSAQLYLENTNVPFQVGLKKAIGTTFLSFQNKNGLGAFGYHASEDNIPLITGEYVDVIAYLNRSNNTFRLDYANVTVVPWTPSDDIPFTDFDQFLITRLTNTASTTGDLFIDNVRVETFPIYAIAWWRCDDPEDAVNERLGSLLPTVRWTSASHEQSSSSDPLYDGEFDYHNPAAFNRFFSQVATNSIDLPPTTNWTAETIFRTATNANMAFLAWGTGLGWNTTGSLVTCGYYDPEKTFYFDIRDAAETNSAYAGERIGSFTPDDRWHHVAFIKSNTTVSLYLDYEFMAETNILLLSDGTSADGSYQFTTNSRAAVGETLNGGNTARIKTRIDEVRFSSKALEISEFLQSGQPRVIEIQTSALNNHWDLLLRLIGGRTYRVETSASLGSNANWQIDGIPFVADPTYNFIAIPTADKTNFVRVIRED